MKKKQNKRLLTMAKISLLPCGTATVFSQTVAAGKTAKSV